MTAPKPSTTPQERPKPVLVRPPLSRAGTLKGEPGYVAGFYGEPFPDDFDLDTSEGLREYRIWEQGRVDAKRKAAK